MKYFQLEKTLHYQIPISSV